MGSGKIRRVFLALLIAYSAVALPEIRIAPTTRAQGAQEAADAATAAALSIFDGVPMADCANSAPPHASCVDTEVLSPDSAARGIAGFGVGIPPNGYPGAHALLGRGPDGSWNVWFTSQNAYQLTALPGDMLICAFGSGAPLRAGPSDDQATIDLLADGSVVTGDQFVLTEPASGHLHSWDAGYGWFHINNPEQGWIYSKYLENAHVAANSGCSLHDAQTAERANALLDQDRASVAISAALTSFNGVKDSDCASNNPQALSCISLQSVQQTIARGIADFAVAGADGYGPYGGVLGQREDSSWGVWFTSQNPYQLLTLPGDLVVCAVSGLTLRSRPDTGSDAWNVLAAGTRATSDQFILTAPASTQGSGWAQGYGWYHISTPEQGWLYSKYLEAADFAGLDQCRTVGSLDTGP